MPTWTFKVGTEQVFLFNICDQLAFSIKCPFFFADKDPEFYFVRKLDQDLKGFTNREATFHCSLNVSGAKVIWKRNGIQIPVFFFKLH